MSRAIEPEARARERFEQKTAEHERTLGQFRPGDRVTVSGVPYVFVREDHGTAIVQELAPRGCHRPRAEFDIGRLTEVQYGAL